LEIGTSKRENAVLIGVNYKKRASWVVEDQLDELEQLALTAGADVVHKTIQSRDRIDPAYYIGKGKCEMLKGMVAELNADLVIFDDDLSPAQVRNLERVLNRRIIDRTGLILDIFARRARTSEAKIEVELAQLNYLLPRLTRHWKHLSRQVGGIGVRGPGETQLETDRRLVRNRIDVLKKNLSKIERGREIRRKRRSEFSMVALVGYTNAGKSTLLNAITGAEVFVEDQLFATLDPAVRAYQDEMARKVIFTDTVGFIRKLPHHLVASFKSTLEEVTFANLLLHIVDLSHVQYISQMESVRNVLEELNSHEKPTLIVFNKIDIVERDSIVQSARERFPEAVFISAERNIGLENLKKSIFKILFVPKIHGKIYIDPPRLHEFLGTFGTINIESKKYANEKVEIVFTAEEKLVEKLKEFASGNEIQIF